MHCVKCGREIPQEQTFCQDCLAEMERYPVKPGTVVQLPHRPSSSPTKKPPQRRKPAPSPEEQIARLRKSVRHLAVLLTLALAALAVLGCLMAKERLQEQVKYLPGQNYSSVSSTTEPSDGD